MRGLHYKIIRMVHVGLPSSSSPHITMASDSCAIGTDGNLLDASEIVWFNDPDDDTPIAPTTTSSTGQPQPSATRLNSSVTRAPLSTHRSTHAARPSTKAINPDNVMAIKHKSSDAYNSNPSRCLHQTSPEHEEEIQDMATDPDAGGRRTVALMLVTLTPPPQPHSLTAVTAQTLKRKFLLTQVKPIRRSRHSVTQIARYVYMAPLRSFVVY